MNLQPHDWAQLANTLKSVRPDDTDELEELSEIKACGANKPGGGGFSAGNTCARGGKGGGSLKKGDRVTLTEHPFMNNETSKLAKGATGTITKVDSAGNATVRWDKPNSKLATTWRADLLAKTK